jgi:signal transduction histidine kinase
MGKEAEIRSIDVHVDISDKLPPFESDRGKLQQIFLNIINNAFASVSDGGHIEILAHPDGNTVLSIKFMDDGCGIPKENIDHIFEPFFSTKTGQGGTGLGLSITYNLIQELGGKISVQSEVGKGTSFTINIPLKIKEGEGD